MSLLSNVHENLYASAINKDLPILREIKDDVEEGFNEISCASVDSALGRYCSINTIKILKSFK
jgi:hypothetical protein